MKTINVEAGETFCIQVERNGKVIMDQVMYFDPSTEIIHESKGGVIRDMQMKRGCIPRIGPCSIDEEYMKRFL